MQFMTTLFGGSAGTLLNALFALGVVLVLIVLAAWLIKMFGRAGDGLSRGGRDRRLVVLESAVVDGKRKLLLIRRDDVEHLVMTGGPSDVVIETGIVAPEAAQLRRRSDTREAVVAAPPAPTPAADIAAPIVPERPVRRDAVDRLHDLARPAPLKPRVALRHTALLRPVSSEAGGVIPMTPELRIDNSASRAADSATAGASDDTGGQVGLGGRNRFFRRVARDRS